MNDTATRPRPSPGKEEWLLVPHPDFPSTDVSRIDVIATRQTNSQIGLRFMLTGNIRQLVLPVAEHPADRFRRDELWRSTCFEAFVRPANGDGYFETNLTPSGHWAAYAFDHYRGRIRDAAVSHHWFRSDDRRADWYDISGNFFFDALENDRRDWHVALSAIVEAKNGTKSYWALAHAPGPPDFHNRDCFIAALPAPDRS